MPFLGMRNNHCTCRNHIQRYLEKGNRALACDTLNIRGALAQREWAKTMDATRAAYGNDTAPQGKRAVTFTHMLFSPDPRDGVDLKTLRSMSTKLARKLFGANGEPGELGCFEVAIVYHDDNTQRIPHAHLIINNTDLVSGRRLQISDYMNEVGIPNLAQEIAEEHGCIYFDNPATLEEKRERDREAKTLEDKRAKLRKKGIEVELQTPGRYTTRAEKRIIREGKYSWKQDLANMVQVARRLSTDEASFLAELKTLGVGVHEKAGDWVFTHPNNKRWTVSGYRLGKNYTRDALNSSILSDRETGCPRIPEVRDNVNADLMSSLGVTFELAAVVERGEDIHDVAKTLRTNDRYGIRCQQDYARVARILELMVSEAADDTSKKDAERKLAELREAQQRAAKGEYFLGVADTGKVPTPPTRKGKGAYGGGRKGGSGASGRGSAGSKRDDRQQSRSRQEHRSGNPGKGGGLGR